MRSYNISSRRGVAVKTAAAAAVALTLAVVLAARSQAQDASKDGSAWNMFDDVLVLPPVYRSDAMSAPADACAEDFLFGGAGIRSGGEGGAAAVCRSPRGSGNGCRLSQEILRKF